LIRIAAGIDCVGASADAGAGHRRAGASDDTAGRAHIDGLISCFRGSIDAAEARVAPASARRYHGCSLTKPRVFQAMITRVTAEPPGVFVQVRRAESSYRASAERWMCRSRRPLVRRDRSAFRGALELASWSLVRP